MDSHGSQCSLELSFHLHPRLLIFALNFQVYYMFTHSLAHQSSYNEDLGPKRAEPNYGQTITGSCNGCPWRRWWWWAIIAINNNHVRDAGTVLGPGKRERKFIETSTQGKCTLAPSQYISRIPRIISSHVNGQSSGYFVTRCGASKEKKLSPKGSRTSCGSKSKRQGCPSILGWNHTRQFNV